MPGADQVEVVIGLTMGTESRHQAPNSGCRGGMTPATRSRLEKFFEHAKAKASGLNPNYDYAAELCAQCVLGDPGNEVYAKTYIEDLQKKYNNNRTGAPLANFKERAARNAMKKALNDQQWDEAIKNAVKVLAVNPWDVTALTAMAVAARKSAYLECEMYYLKSALMVDPKDPAVNRLCAIAATERRLIDQAIHCWRRVEEADSHDDEAKRAIAILQTERMKRGGFSVEDGEIKHANVHDTTAEYREDEMTAERKLLDDIAQSPKHLHLYFELSQLYLSENRYEKADEILAQAFEASNGDPDVREKWEDVQLRGFRYKMLNTADPATKKELQQEYYHKELDFFRKRCERYPSNLFYRYDLGICYMRTKQYNEAIRELQISRNDPRRKGISLLTLGKCFQLIQQNRLALNHYEMAVEEIPDRDMDNKKEALRLAGKMALTLGEVDVAEKHLSVLAARDFAYKDVAALLDKLTEMRKN
jgi:tetratricopeptide (TPR) repeat protein